MRCDSSVLWIIFALSAGLVVGVAAPKGNGDTDPSALAAASRIIGWYITSFRKNRIDNVNNVHVWVQVLQL